MYAKLVSVHCHLDNCIFEDKYLSSGTTNKTTGTGTISSQQVKATATCLHLATLAKSHFPIVNRPAHTQNASICQITGYSERPCFGRGKVARMHAQLSSSPGIWAF